MSHNSKEVSQIADCPVAIEGLSKALVPSLLATLEVIVARNRNELEGNEGECDREDGQRPENQGEYDEGHDNGHNDSGRPILGANMIMCPTCPAGLNIIRAMQLSIMRAMQPSSIRAMQLSIVRAVQPSNIGALQLNTLRAMQLRVMQPSHIGAI